VSIIAGIGAVTGLGGEILKGLDRLLTSDAEKL